MSLSRLPSDVLRQCALFLGTDEIIALSLSCWRLQRDIYSDDFWSQYCRMNLFKEYREVVATSSTPRLLCIAASDMRRRNVVVGSRNGWLTYRTIKLTEVLAVSSCDRIEEKAENLLTPSKCLRLLTMHASLMDPMRSQFMCNCFQTPCYWSSKGTRNKNDFEYVTFKSKYEVCVVHSFCVTPYMAAFQPEHPVFAPRR